MYPTSKYSARSPSPTFVNFSPLPDYLSSHHAMTMKNMISKDLSSTTARTKNIFSEDIDSIEYCVQDNALNCSNDSFSERRRRGHSWRSNHKLDVEQQVKWTRKNIAATMERFEPACKLDYNAIQPPTNHVYSYAYYEPGAAKCHTNIPQRETSSTLHVAGPSKSPPQNSIRALLAKSFGSKTPTTSSSEERHTYTTHYGTQENLYEEVNDQKIRNVLSDNRIVSVSSTLVKEELRRVQHNHFRVLDELNLSLEALIMPPTVSDKSPNEYKVVPGSRNSMENLSSTLTSIKLKDHACINPEFDEADLDSGFSGSGSSSGASYNESLRYYKTGAVKAQTTNLPHIQSCLSSTSNTSTSKSSMNSEDQECGILMSLATSSPFNHARRYSDSQTSAGTKPKRNFWTIKQ